MQRWLVRAAVLLVLLGALTVLVTQCGGDDPDDETNVSTAEAPSTSTNPTIPNDQAAGIDRVPASSDSAITWTMAAAPEAAAPEATAAEVPGVEGLEARAWQTESDGQLERVLVADLGDQQLDLDAILEAYAQTFEGRTTGRTDLDVSGHPGRTAAMIGVVDGKRAIGYVAIADVGDQVVLASTLGAGADPDTLYPRFLQLMGSFRAG